LLSFLRGDCKNGCTAREAPRSPDGIVRAPASMPVFERDIAHMHV